MVPGAPQVRLSLAGCTQSSCGPAWVRTGIFFWAAMSPMAAPSMVRADGCVQRVLSIWIQMAGPPDLSAAALLAAADLPGAGSAASSGGSRTQSLALVGSGGWSAAGAAAAGLAAPGAGEAGSLQPAWRTSAVSCS